VLTARLDYKKIKENKDMSYLDSWFCPLEKACQAGFEPVIKGKIFNVSASQYTPTLILNSIPLKIKRRHAMAGF